MGKVVKSNVGINHRILLRILNKYDKELKDQTVLPWKMKQKIIMTGAYLALCFGASLRGNEGFYLEGSSFVEMIKLGSSERERD